MMPRSLASGCPVVGSIAPPKMFASVVRSMNDLVAVAKEAVKQGYRAVKTNPVFFDREKPYFFSGGFRPAPGFLDRSMNERQLAQIVEQMTAYREAVGPTVGLMLDVSFSQRTEGYLRLAQRLEWLNLAWLEVDINDPESLGLIRRHSRMPIAGISTRNSQGWMTKNGERSAWPRCQKPPT